ncbi:MAG: Rpn family recombination-promoting nuclease/putative transposase [Treponema sp.]|jgi:predicted transposase/invertase (TIGR01784 family)|nr:Rpn family recombination-promoting nuclease/putative transposase [Treponema sp.]
MKNNIKIPEILPVKNDLVFRMFFADERNKEYLICLLKAVLSIPEDEYDEIEIIDPHLLPEYIDDKYAIIDVKLRTKRKNVVHIEIQLQVAKELKKRILFYASKLITEQIGSREKYNEIQNVISIIITDKTLISDSKKYFHHFTFYDHEANIEFSDLVEINTIELDKLPKNVDGSQLYDWAKFINATNEEELAMIAERNPQIKEAVVKLRRLSADEQTRWEYEMREKIRMDKDMFEREAREEGWEEGLLQGKREADENWKFIVADKDAEIARLREQLEKQS